MERKSRISLEDVNGDLYDDGAPEAVYEMGRERENIEGFDYDPRTIAIFETLGVLGMVVIMILTNVVLIIMGKVPGMPRPDAWFGLYIGLFFGIFISTAMLGGTLVTYCGLDVMYTRKCIHFFSFFLPFGMFQLIPFEKSVTTYLLTFCATFVAYMPLVDGVRSLKFMLPLRIAFSSFDRKQDRPMTLLWAVSQSFSAYISLLPCALVLEKVFGAGNFVMLPLMTVAVGDGLAEIVGRKLGRHKYRTRAMCTRKMYTRSIEGSMCVFWVCFITTLILYFTNPGVWNWVQFLVAELTIPIVMTVAEAYAPHSWDNAILLGVGGMLPLLVFCIQYAFE